MAQLGSRLPGKDTAFTVPPARELRRVRLRVLRACHLSASRPDARPFCKIADRTHKGSAALQTEVSEKHSYPAWDEAFELELDEDDQFELALYNRERWFFNDFLGCKRVVLPNAITDLGGTIVQGEERLVTLILDKTSQGFVEVGITPLNFDYGPQLRGSRRELPPTLRCLWDLHSACSSSSSSSTAAPVLSHCTKGLDRRCASSAQPERKGGKRGRASPDAGGDARRVVPCEASAKRRVGKESAEAAAVEGSGGWLPPAASVFSSIAALPVSLRARLSAYFLPPAPDPPPAPSSRPKPRSQALSILLPPSPSSPSTASSSSSSSSYLQLLPPELIASIGEYVERNTPYNPFEGWREDERARFEELRSARARKSRGGRRAASHGRHHHNHQRQNQRSQDPLGWREMRVRVAPSGSMLSTRLGLSASFFTLPSFPLSPKAERRNDSGQSPASAGAEAPAGEETAVGGGGGRGRGFEADGPLRRESVEEIVFLCSANMKRYAFKDKRRGDGITLRQYMLALDDAPMCSDLLRNDKYTICNLFNALGEDFHKWEFFLIRKYPPLHPYGHVRTTEDLDNFIFHNIGAHKLGTVVERERDMIIGGRRALGCTFVATSAVPAEGTLSGARHRTYNCVTNFFVSVNVGGDTGSGREACVFQLQYVTCWTKGNVTRALSNHRKRERLTFYWMLRSIAFSSSSSS